MQSIYEDGIGNLDDYKGADIEKVNEIPKNKIEEIPNLLLIWRTNFVPMV